jgi:hypothetical protein
MSLMTATEPLARVDRPREVDRLGAAVVHRAGNSDRGGHDLRRVRAPEQLHDLDQASVLGAGIDLQLVRLAVAALEERQPRVGPAYIARENHPWLAR